MKKNAGSIKVVALIGGIIILAVFVSLAFLLKGKKTSKVVDSTKYQAVFLTNGQTYFGKVKNEGRDYVNIEDVYYMIIKQTLQDQKDQTNQQNWLKPEYTLVKLGKEIHGPTSMAVNKDQILFIENLADDSSVVSSIKNSQK